MWIKQTEKSCCVSLIVFPVDNEQDDANTNAYIKTLLIFQKNENSACRYQYNVVKYRWLRREIQMCYILIFTVNIGSCVWYNHQSWCWRTRSWPICCWWHQFHWKYIYINVDGKFKIPWCQRILLKDVNAHYYTEIRR